MRLAELIDGLDEVELVGDGDVDVTSIDYDSRQVQPGSLFAALEGLHIDGRDFASAAVDAGAVAVLSDERAPLDVAQIVVPDSRHALGVVSAAFEQHPSLELQMVGVTGTNGKTTTTHMLTHLLDHAGRPCGMIGTLTGARTTPEAPDLQAKLRHFLDSGADSVVMEVSSHALSMRRIDGTRFAVAVFTNLSRDHLDFHESMEDYFHAKARLFEPELTDQALVNIDDPYGRLLLEAANVPTRGFSLADVDDLEVGLTASSFRWRDRSVRVPMGAEFNVRNALAALEAGVELGLEPDVLVAGLGSLPPVAGRFERVERGQPFAVIVDYAHTPDGLEQVLTSARQVAGGGQVLVVFGCGGDRDVTKRPAMGEVASRLAHQVFLTSDNPRGEDPQEIIDDVNSGIATPEGVVIDADRSSAIHAAIASATPGDVVVIAGKGHESTQSIAGVELPFDDRLVAEAALDERFRSDG